MKYDAINLIGNAAASLERKDGGTAYALFELADNLAKVMRGEASLDDFRGCYVGQDNPPFLVDGQTPAERRAKRRA